VPGDTAWISWHKITQRVDGAMVRESIAMNQWTGNVYRGLRRGTWLQALLGREPFYWVNERAGVREFGSKYGRWGIDTSLLNSQTRIASFGLGEDISFERAILDTFGCRIVGFDPTPKSIEYVRDHLTHPHFVHHPVALASHRGTIQFALPPADAADQTSASAVATYRASGDSATIEVPCVDLRGAMELAGLDAVEVLKMDVEGTEYEVLLQAVNDRSLEGVQQLLVEFHHFLPGLNAGRTRHAIAALRKAGFEVAWVGRTNHEYLFLKR
jgi:FkbM family methyltransferase